MTFQRLPRPFGQGLIALLPESRRTTLKLVGVISVARVRSRTSTGHHRPVIASSFLRLNTDGPSKKWLVNCRESQIKQDTMGRHVKATSTSTHQSPSLEWPLTTPPRRHYLAGWGLVRYRNKPDRSPHQLRTAMHHHPYNQERAFNLSILLMSGPGEISVLSRIEPQAPLLVVPFRQFL